MAHSTPEIKSYVVSFDHEGKVKIEPSYWAPGYTSAHQSTEVDALVKAIEVNRQMRAIYEKRELALKFALAERCQDCNYDTHRCGGCGEYLVHGQNICSPCREEFKV